MNDLETPEGKLLYLVYDMQQRGDISQRDRGILKGSGGLYTDMIINANPIMLEKYREYDNNGTELTLKNSLRSLLWNKKHESNDFSLPRRQCYLRGIKCLLQRHEEEVRD